MGSYALLVDFCGKKVKNVFCVCLPAWSVRVTINVQVVLMGITTWLNRSNATLNVH